MIKVDKGHITFEGSFLTLYREYLCVTRSMIDIFARPLSNEEKDIAPIMLLNTVEELVRDIENGNGYLKPDTRTDLSDVRKIIKRLAEEGGNND